MCRGFKNQSGIFSMIHRSVFLYLIISFEAFGRSSCIKKTPHGDYTKKDHSARKRVQIRIDRKTVTHQQRDEETKTYLAGTRRRRCPIHFHQENLFSMPQSFTKDTKVDMSHISHLGKVRRRRLCSSSVAHHGVGCVLSLRCFV